MRVIHVIGGLGREAGGPSRSIQGLVAAQCVLGVDAWLVTLSKGDVPWVDGVRQFKELTGGTKSFPEFLERLKPNLVHIHGIWGLELHRCAVICRKKKIPYVIAPRGMLEPWSVRQKWLKKRIARFLYQDRDLKKAAALHATAASEAAQFRKLGFKNYCIISPNGVNVPDSLPANNQQLTTNNSDKKRALFVSRMHPKKGVLELVESWARMKPQGWQCELVYTLNGDEEKAYEQQVKDRIRSLGLSYQDDSNNSNNPNNPNNSPDFILTGPLNDDAKWDAYARADLFILPTYSENFGIVVAEALYAGVPVITTKGTPWSDLLGSNSNNSNNSNNPNNSPSRSGWWIDLPAPGSSDWPALDSALREATNSQQLTTNNLSEMGANGKRLVESKYLWSAVVKAMVHGYEQILNTCENAPCDMCDNYGDTCPMK